MTLPGGGIKQRYQNRNGGANRTEEKNMWVRPRPSQRESEGAARQPGNQLPPSQCQETTSICVQCGFATSFSLRMHPVWQDPPGFLAAQVSKCWSRLPRVVFHPPLQHLSGPEWHIQEPPLSLGPAGWLAGWMVGWLKWNYPRSTTFWEWGITCRTSKLVSGNLMEI